MNENQLFKRPEDVMGKKTHSAHNSVGNSIYSVEEESTGSDYVKRNGEKSHFAKSKK